MRAPRIPFAGAFDGVVPIAIPAVIVITGIVAIFVFLLFVNSAAYLRPALANRARHRKAGIDQACGSESILRQFESAAATARSESSYTVLLGGGM